VEKNISTMCAPGYPVSGATAAFGTTAATTVLTVAPIKPVHRVESVFAKRDRYMATGVTVPQNADLPSVRSVTTSERRT